jgi:dTDP-4-dehydrorhamnose 3,5-epimerase
MKFLKTNFKGVYEINYQSFTDKRGFFTKIFSDKSFQEILNFVIKQVNISTTSKIGSFRGLHYQRQPYAEQKIIFCLKGKIIDYIVNIDKKSKDYLKVFCIEIDSKSKNGLLIPSFYAHGFITLEKDTTVVYLHDNEYSQKHEMGIRYNDPLINLDLPMKIKSISDKDQNYPNIIK